MKAASITTLVFDFDGVFRHFDPETTAKAEAMYQLEPGSILEAAFQTQDYLDVARGKVKKAEWVATTANLIGSQPAAEVVLNDTGTLDLEMVSLLDEVSASGYKTALLTNSTCSIDSELEEFGLSKSFDRIFTTHKIGHAKPDPEIFSYVCEQMSVAPAELFFTDDLPDNVEGAKNFGIAAQLFTSTSKLRSTIESLND